MMHSGGERDPWASWSSTIPLLFPQTSFPQETVDWTADDIILEARNCVLNIYKSYDWALLTPEGLPFAQFLTLGPGMEPEAININNFRSHHPCWHNDSSLENTHLILSNHLSLQRRELRPEVCLGFKENTSRQLLTLSQCPSARSRVVLSPHRAIPMLVSFTLELESPVTAKARDHCGTGLLKGTRIT